MMFFIQLFVFMAWLYKDGVSGLFEDVSRDIANILPDLFSAFNLDAIDNDGKIQNRLSFGCCSWYNNTTCTIKGINCTLYNQ